MLEHELAGGQMNGSVTKAGATVRRATGPHTATVHRVLQHVADAGLEFVPRVHGVDEQGREVLDFIEGDVPHGDPAWLWEDSVLTSVARAMRRWHDATASFDRRPDDTWMWAPMEPAEVIVHEDFAPYNCVFRDGALVGVIDFDTCIPGPRVWDLAYTAYRFISLMPPPSWDVDDSGYRGERSPFEPAQMRARLELFMDAYGGAEVGLTTEDILAAIPGRLESIARWCAEQDNPDLVTNGRMYLAHAEWIAGGGVEG